MPERSLLAACLQGLLALVCMLVIALALGALWVAMTLHFRSAAWWFALPVGLAMGYATCTWVTHSRALGMPLAAAGTLLAAVYMQCLLMGLRLAAVMGLGYLTTLHTAGASMLLALARAAVEPRFMIVTALGMLLAGWTARHRRTRKTPAAK